MPTPRFVLASASPARLQLLRSAGFRPEVVVSGVDEDVPAGTPVAAAVALLAERKAAAVAVGTPAALVLGCDSLLEWGGQAYGKPADRDEARRRWHQLRGTEGRLLTGHCLIDGTAPGAPRATRVAATTVRFGQPTDAELEAYLQTGEPTRVAGGFTLDGYGGAFIDGVDGDAGTVLGLSLPVLRELLADRGIAITDLWS